MPAPNYPLTMPTAPGFTSSRFELKRATAFTESPFTGAQQVQLRDYALWEATLTLPRMNARQVGVWQAFMMRCHGRRGTFYLADPDRRAPLGAINADGTIATAVSAGTYDIIVAFTGTPTGGVVAGDYIQIGSGSSAKLHMITSDVALHPLNPRRLALTVEPALKVAVGVGTTVILRSPRGIFRMTTNALGWDADNLSRYGVTIACREAL